MATSKKTNIATSSSECCAENCKCRKGASGLVIAGFLLLGMGIGFIAGSVPAGLFSGLGIGLLVAAIMRYRCKC